MFPGAELPADFAALYQDYVGVILPASDVEATINIHEQCGAGFIVARLDHSLWHIATYRAQWPLRNQAPKSWLCAASHAGIAPSLVSVERSHYAPQRPERDLIRAVRALPPTKETLVALTRNRQLDASRSYFAVLVRSFTRIGSLA